MERILVVLDDSDSHRELLAEAASVAQSTGAELVLFAQFSREDFEQDIKALEAAETAERADYSEHTAADFLQNFVNTFVADVFEGDAPDYEVETAVADDTEEADEIVAAANDRDCDYVYLVGRRRSPAGKVLFGDVAQSVILNFDGYVTTAME